MRKPILPLLFLLAYCTFMAFSADLMVQREVVGPLKNNCYLLFDEQSKEAALVDVAGPVDSLLARIKKEGLRLKYVLITHAHADHTAGIPAIQQLFPAVQVCVSKEEVDDAPLYRDWRKQLDPKEVRKMESLPWAPTLMDFDFRAEVQPEVFVKGGDVILLGSDTVRAILSPGHSRGSICFAVDTMLFSGDVLFNGSVGRTDLPGGGGWDSLVVSVRRLYASLPDESIVYPGHGPPTILGTEKRENPRISERQAQRRK